MNELENYLEKFLVIHTNENIFSGELMKIDDDIGAIVIKEKDAQDLKTVSYTDIIHCELENITSNDSYLSENPRKKSCTSTVDRIGSIFKPEPIYRPKFVHMTVEQKNSLLKDNYRRFWASKEASAVTSGIYSTNYIIDRVLKNDRNKKICVLISRSDWFSEVAFNISRALLRHGFLFELFYQQSPDQKSVNHILYLNNESIKKPKEVKGNFDLAIVATSNYESVVNNDQFNVKQMVCVTVPNSNENIAKTSISALFFGPFEKRFSEFKSELVYVESGMSQKARAKFGVEYLPLCGYIIYRK